MLFEPELTETWVKEEGRFELMRQECFHKVLPPAVLSSIKTGSERNFRLDLTDHELDVLNKVKVLMQAVHNFTRLNTVFCGNDYASYLEGNIVTRYF